MINRGVLLSILLLAILDGNCQQTKTADKNSRHRYKDFVVKHDTIWALTDDGNIRLLRAGNGDFLEKQIVSYTAITQLAVDKNNHVVIGDKDHAIKRYDPGTNSWTQVAIDTNTLLGITFDSNNNCFLLTNKGIVDVSSHQAYIADSSANYQILHHGKWSRKPVFMMDDHDNLWIGFGYGEWGGELFIFNCKDKKFIEPDLGSFAITLNPVKSIFQGSNKVFVTAGLMHFSTSGSIAQFDQFKCRLTFGSDMNRSENNDATGKEVAGEYIGPGSYNPVDKCIYFYSQHGIFKGNPEKDLSKIEYWEKVAQPKLAWSDGQPDAVGSPMNVLKMTINYSGKLFFLSENDGIGILNGKTLIIAR